YMSDLSRLLAASETEFKNLAGSATGRDASSWGGGPQPFQMTPGSTPGPDDGSVPATEPPRGYLVTLQLRTPNADKFNFVYNSVIRSLEGIDLAAAFPDRHYYLAKAGAISSAPVSNRPGASDVDARRNAA